jgi:von Willebrand factor type A domain
MSPIADRPSPTWKVILAAFLAALGAAGCATGQQLEVKKVDAVVQPPSNVALYLKITRQDGQPVTLLANDFKVYEDGKQVPPKKMKRALLPVKYAVDRYVLVLVDLSGPLVDSEYLSTLQDAVSSLAERVGKDARMGLSAFDGDGIVPFIQFDDAERKAGLAAMRKFRPRSRNIDLWGAFIAALDGLDAATKQSPAPHQRATLILVTDRRDKAGRHSQAETLARVLETKADVFVIGIGDGINREELEPLGKTGALFAAEARDLQKPFVDLADRIEAQLGQDYLFSYCSPQKAGKKGGKHTVELRIATAQWHASVEHEFSTRGFTKQACDPEAKPEFKPASKDSGGHAAAPEKTEESAEGDEAKPKSRSKEASKRAKKKVEPAASTDPADPAEPAESPQPAEPAEK